jgi:methylphosphotriester-DNA--protein-cysteine methyltransferase
MSRVLLTVLLLLTLGAGVAGAEYWGSSASTKYHFRHCWWAKTINKEYLVRFATADAAFRAGYTPCSKCRPPVTDRQPDARPARGKGP